MATEEKGKVTTSSATSKPRASAPDIPKMHTCSLVVRDDVSASVDLEKEEKTFFRKIGGREEKITKLKLKGGRLLTATDSIKKVLHLVFEADNLQYMPGEAFGIVCANRKETVKKILQQLSLDGEKRLIVENAKGEQLFSARSLFELLRTEYDLHAPPKKVLLRVLAEFSDQTDKEKLLHLSSRTGSADYNELVTNQVGLAELLTRFPSCRPPVEYLLELLPPLQPRYYSAASSPLHHPGELHFALTVVEVNTADGRTFEGLCSNKLAREYEKTTKNPETEVFVPIFPRPPSNLPNSFKYPDDQRRPLIMIGPGTGVAPFIGFLQHRKELMKLSHSDTSPSLNSDSSFGPSILFFGCRYENKDYLFKEELESFNCDGVLTHLVTAFSREVPGEVVYVQHKMTEWGALLTDWMLNKDALIFVCGDAKGMIKGVRETLLSIVQQHAELDAKSANDLVSKWSTDKRFILDIWL
eukprot:TRINITY_DN8784_c0_g1_i1.p1 TRINITY_DN8784_c0_g1~~TRINITY_DN8784_c0_g1_i1.p1  ORF type:complete len:470 (-),score=87.62 TRINITY_DN8784_c0_g1_i1:211-1620(-)